MNANDLITAWKAAQGDLSKEQAFLSQHCQDMLSIIEEQQEAISEWENGDMAEELEGLLEIKDNALTTVIRCNKKLRATQERLVQRIRQLKASNEKLREALIGERAQVIAISEYYHHDWHDRFYTDGENLEDDAEKELQKEGIL